MWNALTSPAALPQLAEILLSASWDIYLLKPKYFFGIIGLYSCFSAGGLFYFNVGSFFVCFFKLLEPFSSASNFRNITK